MNSTFDTVRAEALFASDLSIAEQPTRSQVIATIRLLKDRVAHAGNLIDALQRVATGGTAVDRVHVGQYGEGEPLPHIIP